jgi:hypothetical protein
MGTAIAAKIFNRLRMDSWPENDGMRVWTLHRLGSERQAHVAQSRQAPSTLE